MKFFWHFRTSGTGIWTLFILCMGAPLFGCDSPTNPREGDELTVTPPDPKPLQIAAYHVSWLGTAWADYNYEVIDQLYFFDLAIQEDGTLSEETGWPFGWVELIDQADAAGVPLHLTVSLFDPDIFNLVMSDSLRKATLTEELRRLSQSGAVSGVQFDIEMFEPVQAGLRDTLSGFVERAAAAMRDERSDFDVSMFLLAEDPWETYDETRLAAALDRVVVQGYDLHWMGDSHSGPVANVKGWGTRNWSGILARMDGLGIERSKMIFSVPFYGYEWPTTGPEPGASTRGPGQLTTYAPVLTGIPSARERADTLATMRDRESGTPFYAWTDSTGWNQGWFDDAYSVFDKARFARENGLGGIIVFPYGYGDATLETALRWAKDGEEDSLGLANALAQLPSGESAGKSTRLSRPNRAWQRWIERRMR